MVFPCYGRSIARFSVAVALGTKFLPNSAGTACQVHLEGLGPLNFLFGKIRVKLGLEDQNFAKHEGNRKLKTHLGWPQMPIWTM